MESIDKNKIMELINWLDLHSGSMGTLATITLALLTAGYLLLTYRLTIFSFRQVSSDIKLSRVYLVSNIGFNGNFKKGQFKEGEILKVFVSFNAFNANAGPGSFERPTLHLYKGSNLILNISPLHDNAEDRIIYLTGGEGKKIVQKYVFTFQRIIHEKLFEEISTYDINALKNYKLSYFDNLGKEHFIKDLQDFEPDEEAWRFFSGSLIRLG